MSHPNFTNIVGSIIFAIGAGCVALIWVGAVVIEYFHLLTRFQGWVTQDPVKLSSLASNLQTQFYALDFQLIGIAKSSIFLISSPMYTTCYTDKSGIVLIELGNLEDSEPSYTLNTWFPDNTLIETQYPRIETVISEHFESVEAVGSMMKIVENHLERVNKKIALTDQSPVVITSREQILEYNKIYKQLYQNTKLRRLNINILLQALCFSLISFSCLGFSSLYTMPNAVDEMVWVLLGLASFGMAVWLSGLKAPTRALKKTAPKR